MTDSTPNAPLDDRLALDRFIAGNAPDWLKDASIEELDELKSSLATHQRCQARVGTLLAALQAPDAFALPRLTAALRPLGCDPQTPRALWREVRLRVEFSPFRVTEVDLPVFRYYPVDTELLPRLLQNFSAEQAGAGFYYPGAGVVEDGRLLACAPARLAAACRALDLGGQYQRHLDEVLTPRDAQARQEVLDLLAADRRATLVAQARCAYLKGDIDADAQQLLLDFAADGPTPSHVRCCTLQLFGFSVPGAMLLEIAGTAPTLAGQRLLHLPGDPLKPVRQFPSSSLLNDELATDLRYERYVEFFTRQLERDDRLSFLGKLRSAMTQVRPQLQAQGLASTGDSFAGLARRQIERIKSDAALLLVPTASIDQVVHRQRVQALESAGLTVVSVLASFIPGVGELMLVGLVKDLLSEVYEGVVDWSHGQREEALGHLLGVVGNLTLSAVVAGGSTLALRELRRSAFVDNLLPVSREAAAPRLCAPDHGRYRAPLTLASASGADGLLSEQGRHWWRCDEQLFEVRQASISERWRIVHPSRPRAWTPELTGNGDGAWWHAGEHPLQWQGSAYLLRRLGPRSEGLSATLCEQAALICGYDQARLRGLLVERRPMPVALVQVLDDFRLQARITRFFTQLADGTAAPALDQELCTAARQLLVQAPAVGDERLAWRAAEQSLGGALFEHFAAATTPSLDAQGLKLQRAFPALPGPFVQSLLDAAEVSARADGRIPLALQEQARDSVREVRILRALEGLYLDARCAGDTVRMVFSLFRQLPRWPRGLSFELREGAFEGPVLERLLPTPDAREMRVLVGTRGRYAAFDGQGGALGDASVSLFQALVDGLGATHCATLGYAGDNPATALRAMLREQASADRERLPGLLGMSVRPGTFRAPRRFADGRLGYPLSGRGLPGRTTLTGMVRNLYPGFNDLEASVWLDELHQQHGDPMSELLRLQDSLRSLDRTLARWQQETSLAGRSARRRVADEIRRCWCRQTPPVCDVDGRIIGYRLRLGRSQVGNLPELPDSVDFAHVVDLVLSGSGQWRRLDGFLRRFTRLRWLDLGQNGCSEMPSALASMTQLRELYLDGNNIHLSHAGQATLSTLTRLEVLNLDRNPLGRVPDVSHLPRLRRLSLRGTGIRALPEGLPSRPFLELADLRGNQLSLLPEAFFSAPARIRSATVLFGNPLRDEVRERLWQAGEADGLAASALEPDGVREQWLAGMHDTLLRERDEQWQGLRGEPGSQGFFSLLGNLLDTADYRLAPAHLQERVWQMIGAAVESSVLRESLFELANAPTTCIDSVSSAFSVLDVRLQVSLARTRVPDGEQGAALLAFARRLFRLDRVEQFARQVITQRQTLGQTVDEVEVSLAFRVRLADALALPGQPRHMQFGDIAAVSEQDLKRAKDTVETAEGSPALADFIARQDFWLEHLRERHAVDFRRVEGQFWDRLERLCEQRDQLAEGDYLQRMNQLGAERETALHEQARRLTEEALQPPENP
ncbi:NEL-type E3 ubiquitin ligase domain-containing protein [Pseudomonas japonica]|uniref:RING-type E3 ubiquitin transferase n=1 Tax=Pseudomonas japonica TaxID=256466 RepID=A0A239HXQ5_9PSED|nr:NEL-type E3 ubiquitin ligase domain-containing protein [Pseudomonas japonica]SNS85014.1 C-terminal novel E3 ligase, LRR-interacting [Pseudomonas japonica]